MNQREQVIKMLDLLGNQRSYGPGLRVLVADGSLDDDQVSEIYLILLKAIHNAHNTSDIHQELSELAELSKTAV